MFTTPIIYKPASEADRQEFIKHLEDVGYIVFGSSKGRYIVADDDSAATYYSKEHNYLAGCYYCGSNLPLAKALSALRDDSDFMQWFVGPFDVFATYENIKKGSTKWRKATKEKLIEHFKA